jgi:hypothetical protein
MTNRMAILLPSFDGEAAKANNGAILREAPMPATISSVLTADRARRREAAEQKRTKWPAEQLFAHNRCIALLVELEPRAALAVVQRIEKGIVEFLEVQARG